MAKKETIDAGKSIFERALAKLPADKRESIKFLLDDEDVLGTLGESGLMREDYSRLADEAKAQKLQFEGLYNSNLTWREERATALAKADELKSTIDRMKAAGINVDGEGAAASTTTTTPAPAGMTKAEFEQALRGTESQGLAVMTKLTKIGLSHYKEFGDVLEPEEVVKLAQTKGVDLDTAYNTLVSTRREERRADDVKKQIEKAKKEGYEEAMTKASSTPYPVGHSSEGGVPTTLSGLTKDAAKRNDFGVDAAVRQFNASRSRIPS
jgi:hypothetical protein